VKKYLQRATFFSGAKRLFELSPAHPRFELFNHPHWAAEMVLKKEMEIR